MFCIVQKYQQDLTAKAKIILTVCEVFFMREELHETISRNNHLQHFKNIIRTRDSCL